MPKETTLAKTKTKTEISTGLGIALITLVAAAAATAVGFAYLAGGLPAVISQKNLTGSQVNAAKKCGPAVEFAGTKIFQGCALDSGSGLFSNFVAGLDGKNQAAWGKKNFQGYIVEFGKDPVLKKKTALEKQAKANLTLTPKYIASKIQEQVISVNQEHELLKNKIKSKLGIGAAKTADGKLKLLGEYKKAFNGIALDITEKEAKALRKIAGVKRVYPNYEVQTTLMDSIPQIKANNVWLLDEDGNNCATSGKPCLTGAGITIAIIDTGIDYTHFDLGGCFGANCKVVGGYDFVNNDNDPMDDHGHGTHVAATAAGNGILKGVAPDAKLYSYKVLNFWGSGWWDDIIAAVERAADPNQDGNFSDMINVISLSLGGPGNPDDPISQTIDNVVEAGIVAVVAAGNSGPGEQTIGSPGTSRKAITVGAVNRNKTDSLAYFSSRGPVIWQNGAGEEKALIKPDVVAPGVSICAAQWDNAWSDYECLDNEHTAISGTSMATPHVAGAAALLKQKNPDWSPDEIKAALKATAVDLALSPVEQGAGRIDVLGAVGLERKPCTARIDTNGEVSNILNIAGSAQCDNFNGYKLYYKYESTDWNEFYTSANEVAQGNLYSGFDTTPFNDGKFLIKLAVSNIYGEKYEDIALININNFEINSIGDYLNYLKGNEIVRGEIKLPDYEAYKIEYSPQSGGAWQQICYQTNKPSGDVLCAIDAASLGNGAYFFRLAVLRNGKWTYNENFKAAVIHELIAGWPVETACNTFSVTPSDINSDTYGELTNISAVYCGQGWSFENKIDIYNHSGAFTSFRELRKGGNLMTYVNSFDPLAMLNGNIISPNDYYLGAVDSTGNYQGNWPFFVDGLFSIDIWTIDKETGKMFVILGNIWGDGEKTVYLYGFDEFGNLLPNFPVRIQNEPGFGEWAISRQKILIKNNGKNYLGVLFANFNNNNYTERNGKLFFEIYSEEGELIKRTLLSDDSDKKVGYDHMSFASGDLNNDLNTEIAVGYFVLDFGKYFENQNNPEAYQSHLKVLDAGGTIISEPYNISGYSLKNVRIGNFNRPKLDIVFQLADTFATYGQAQKIVAMNYQGDVLFNASLDDYNKIVEGISIGDVTGDGSSDVVVTYRPRWWDEQPSGIMIYNKRGLLEKEIIIPTFGEAEQLEYSDSAILGDINNNGKVDIVQRTLYLPKNLIGAWKSHIFIFEPGAAYNPLLMDWPMFLHDPQHTGLFVNRIVDLLIKDVSSVGTPEAPALSFNICMNGPFSLADIGLGAFTFQMFTYDSSGQESQKFETSWGGSAVSNLKNGECVLIKNRPLTSAQIPEFNAKAKVTLKIDPDNTISETNKENNIVDFIPPVDLLVKDIASVGTPTAPAVSFNICMNGLFSLADIGLGAFTFQMFTYDSSGQESQKFETSLGGSAVSNIKNGDCVFIKNLPLTAGQIPEFNANPKVIIKLDPGNSISETDKTNNEAALDATPTAVPTVNHVSITNCPSPCSWQAGTSRELMWTFSNFSPSGADPATAVNTVVLNFCNPVTQACTISVNAGIQLNKVWSGYGIGRNFFNLKIGANILTNPALQLYINNGQSQIKICPTYGSGQVVPSGVCASSPVFTITPSTTQ